MSIHSLSVAILSVVLLGSLVPVASHERCWQQSRHVATALGVVDGEVEAVKVGDVVADVLAARPSKLAARKLAARPSAGAGSGERAPCPRGCISRRPTPGIARPERGASLRAKLTGTIIISMGLRS